MGYGGLQLFLALLITCASPVGFLEEGDIGVLFFGWFLAFCYAVVGAAHLVAGYFCRQYRGRIPVLIVLCAGILSCPFCGVLSFALPIYGMVVLLQDDVARAFEAGGEEWVE